jgi:hypothetical protein
MKAGRDGRITIPVPALAWEMMQIITTERVRRGDDIQPGEIARLSYDLVFAHIAEGNRDRVQVAGPEAVPRSPFDPTGR